MNDPEKARRPYVEPAQDKRLDISDLVASCFESEVWSALLDQRVLPPEFFDLRTGFAGELLHKLTMYRIRLAAVVPDASIYSANFQAFLREANRGSEFRFFPTREEAVAWLESS